MIHRLAWFFVIAQGVLWVQYPIAVPTASVTTKSSKRSTSALAYADEDRGAVVILPVEKLQEELPGLYHDGQLRERPPEWFLERHARFRELPDSVPSKNEEQIDENTETGHETDVSQPAVVPEDQSCESDSDGMVTSWSINGPRLFCMVWVVGMGVILLLRTVGYGRLLWQLRKAENASPEQNRQWHEIQTAMGITPEQQLRLLLTDQIGPGIVTRPGGAVVLVPESLWDEASETVREGILRHELSHYRHHDGLKSLLFFLIALLHWFNPTAWLAWRKFNAAAEWRCDLEAYGRNDDSLYRFAESMLTLHKTTDRHVALLHGFKNRDLEERVQRLKEHRKSPKESLMKKAFIVIVAGLCLGCGGIKFVPVTSSSANLTEPVVADDMALPAQSPVEPQIEIRDNADAPGFETLTAHGTVVDEQGQPVVGANVYVLSTEFITGEKEQPIAVSDAEGRFSLPQYGNYHETLIAETEDRSLIGTCKMQDQVFRIVMKPSRTITGRVFDGNLEPIAGAVVFGQLNYTEYGRSETGDDGRFSFRFPADIPMEAVVALKPGVGFDYVYTLEKPTSDEYRRFGINGDPQKRQKSDGPFALTLDGVQDIRLKVVDEEGSPIEGIIVSPWIFKKTDHPDDLNMLCRDYIKKSNAQGEVVYDFIPTWQESTLTFWVRDENTTDHEKPAYQKKRIDLPAAEFGGEVIAVMKPAVRVRGTVRYPDGTPAHGWWLRAQGEQGQFEQSGIDENGCYEVHMIPDTKVNLSIERPDGAWGETIAKDWAARTNILVETGTGSDLVEDFTLEKGTRISGLCTEGKDARPVMARTINVSVLLPGEKEKKPEERSLDSWWWVRTDEQGRYEFWATPGDYQLWFQYGTNPKETVLLNEGEEQVVDFHVDTPEDEEITTLKGRVFIDDEPAEGVIIFCETTEFRLWDEFQNYKKTLKKTNENGEFEIPAGPFSVYIQAMSSDQLFGRIVKVSPKQEEVEIHLTPTSVVTGQVFDKETDKPLDGMRVGWASMIPDEEHEGCFTTGFSASTVTTSHGRYLFCLAEGETYQIGMDVPARGEICESGSCSNPSQQIRLGEVTPKAGDVIDLGTRHVDSRPTAKQEMEWNFFDAYGWRLDNYGFEERFRAVTQKCQRDGKNMLVVFAAVEPTEEGPKEWLSSRSVTKPVAELMRLLHEEKDVFARTEHYYLMGVRTDKTVLNQNALKAPYENAATFARIHGVDEKALENLTLCVFDASGKLLAVEYLAPNGQEDVQFDKAAIIRLLERYKPSNTP